MPNDETKKIRITKIAADFNLAADVILQFLQDKKFDVKSKSSLLSEEMIEAVKAHYKKDIEKAEKAHKKQVEFQKKREATHRESAHMPQEPQHAETVIEETPPVQDDAPLFSDSSDAPLFSSAESESSSLGEPGEVSGAAPVQETLPFTQEELAPAKQELQKAAPAKTTQSQQSSSNDRRDPAWQRKGLKVVGRMSLDEKKPLNAKPTDTNLTNGKPSDGKPVVPKAADAKPGDQKPLTAEEEAAKKKKRKKKSKIKKKPDVPKVEEKEPVKKKARVKKFEIDQKEVKESIRKTLLTMDESSVSNRAQSKKRKKREREQQGEIDKEIRLRDEKKLSVTEFIAVNELANLMDVSVSEVIAKCMSLGLFVSINQRLDVDSLILVADEFGFEIEIAKEYTVDTIADSPDSPEDLTPRSPVVTIMGHVDHGKTSLLDYIRSSNVVAGEAGGITQHIGAYRVQVTPGKFITFLDTPGHEAFTAMRARGAQITDIVILVVAADDAVMPQTIEAINHALAANVPIIVAINKIDKPDSNADRIKQQLADKKILVEEWGGKYQSVEVSAKKGFNIDLLLEKVLLEAEFLELKANAARKARGVVIEAQLDKGRGVATTVLVQKGTLRIGDPFVAGVYHGRVRAMFDERNKKVFEAGPSVSVVILGLEGAPQAGDLFVVVDSERDAREVAVKRQQLKREQDNKQVRHITLDEISRQISIGGVKELPLIVKGDVDGSVEALSDSLMKISTQEVVVRVIHKGVGGISENDVLLASASGAIIIGFQVRPNLNARRLAETQQVDIRLYHIIYDAINEVKQALEGLLSPVISEEVTATVEVRETFKVPKVGTIAGCYVLEGKITRNNKIRIVRDGIEVFGGEINALKRFKDDVREVDAGYECGLSVHNFNDIKVGDIIESYKMVETKKKLS